MANKIFNPQNGKIITLDDDYQKAEKQKESISEAYGKYNVYWMSIFFRPIFSSRGEYLGYFALNEFKTIN